MTADNEPRPEDTLRNAVRFRRRFKQMVWIFVQDNPWSILSSALSFICGGVVAYVALWVHVSDANHAAHDALDAATELKHTVESLVTRDQFMLGLRGVNQRIDDFEQWRTRAQDVGDQYKDFTACKKGDAKCLQEQARRRRER